MLKKWGWNSFWAEQFLAYENSGLVPGRVISDSREIYEVITDQGKVQARLSGSFYYKVFWATDFPVTGDFVLLRKQDDTFLVEVMLPRQKAFFRKSPGSDERQIIGANVDYTVIVSSLDGGRNFNLRRLERYISMAREGGSTPFILLNKIDLVEEATLTLQEAQSVAGDIPVFALSALSGEGIKAFKDFFPQQTTLLLTGPSGVGKSTLINKLLDCEELKTSAQRQGDKRGRHTTTMRSLYLLSEKIMVIDSPGLREIQLFGDQQTVDSAFPEIEKAALLCKFKDCSHRGEPGCEVKKLLCAGVIPEERFENYLEMKAEVERLNARSTYQGRAAQKRKEKNLSKLIKRNSFK